MSHFLNPNDARDARKIEFFLSELETRTISDLHALHFMKLEDGTFYCLDLSISAPMLSDLDMAVMDYLSQPLDIDEILPAASTEKWMEFVECKKLIRWTTLDIPNLPTTKLPVVLVSK